MTVPEISVVIPHYSDLERLGQCLAALDQQSVERSRFEIIVSDNNSPEGRDAVAAVVGDRARLVVSLPKGAGPTRNAGIAEAKGEILALTDSDCLPSAEWLASGLEALERYDVVGGRVDVSVEDREAITPEEAFETVFAFDNETYIRQKGFTVTANLFCRRKVFDAVGGFSNGMSEDVEWCRRATGLGYSLGYAEAAAVSHPARRTWGELTRKWGRLVRETYQLEPGGAASDLKWLLRTWALLPSIIAHSGKPLTSADLPTFGTRMAALSTLAKIRLWRFVEGHKVVLSKD